MVLTFVLVTPLVAQSKDNSESGVSVTKENYAHAMVDQALQREFLLGANNSNWHHHRTLIELDKQPARNLFRSFIIRMF